MVADARRLSGSFFLFICWWILAGTGAAAAQDCILSVEEKLELKEVCNALDVTCFIFVEEPTYVERTDSSAIHGDATLTLFECQYNEEEGFNGVLFDMTRGFEIPNKRNVCIWANQCSFDGLARLVADKSDVNPNGIGQEIQLVYAEYLLYSELREKVLRLKHSFAYHNEKVVLIRMNPGYLGMEFDPVDLVLGAATPEVYSFLFLLLGIFAVAEFWYGGSEQGREPEPDANIGVLKRASDRFGDIVEPVDALPRRRLNRLRNLHFLEKVCLGGAIFLFEAVLLVTPRTAILKAERPLETLIADGKVYIVNNTALMESMMATFPTNSGFKTCPSFSECTKIVAEDEHDKYLLTLESLAFSNFMANYNVAVFETDVELNVFPGVFFFSSAMPADEKSELNLFLLEILRDHNIMKKAISKHTSGRSSDGEKQKQKKPVFTLPLLLVGLLFPAVLVLSGAVILFLMCLVWEVYTDRGRIWQVLRYGRVVEDAGELLGNDDTETTEGTLEGEKEDAGESWNNDDTVSTEGSLGRTRVATPNCRRVPSAISV